MEKTLRSVIGTGTEKLYYEDAYLSRFTAEVVRCEKAEQGYLVELDRTAFFPEEGGQCADYGTFTVMELPAGADNVVVNEKAGAAADEIRVLDVQVAGGIITHLTDSPLEAGTKVQGNVDFAHRFSNMQQHSAEHLFCGIVNRDCGYRNVGFHLSADTVTMDFSGPLSEAFIRKAETEVNQLIWHNIESRQYFLTEEEAEKMEFRSKAEIQGQIRVIVFPGVDACACCAPHVARTGEIGVFKVIAAQNWKGGTRIHMLAGDRAFAYIAKEHEMLHSTARFLSTSAENVESRVRAMREETQKLSLDLSIAREQLVLQDVAGKSLSEENVCVFTEGLTPASQRRIVNTLMETHSGYCGVFEGNETGYRYVIGGPQIAALEKLLEMKLGAKGGGREPMMQGSITAAEEEIRAVFEGVRKA